MTARPVGDLIEAGRALVEVRLKIARGDFTWEHSALLAETRAWDRFNLALDAAENALRDKTAEVEEPDVQVPPLDHKPGPVTWPKDRDVMEAWVQSALDDPRPGDRFHEMYSYLVTVFSVEGDKVAWADNTGRHHEHTRDEWSEMFRYGAIPGHTVQLLTRGEPQT